MTNKVERAAKEAMAAAPGKLARLRRSAERPQTTPKPIVVTPGTPGYIPDESRELYPWRRTHASMAQIMAEERASS